MRGCATSWPKIFPADYAVLSNLPLFANVFLVEADPCALPSFLANRAVMQLVACGGSADGEAISVVFPAWTPDLGSPYRLVRGIGIAGQAACGPWLEEREHTLFLACPPPTTHYVPRTASNNPPPASSPPPLPRGGLNFPFIRRFSQYPGKLVGSIL